MTAPEIRHSLSRVSKPVCLLSGARRHTCLDYDPTLFTSTLMSFATIKIYCIAILYPT